MIDSLLEEHVMKQQNALDKFRERLREIQREIDDNPEKESDLKVTYKYWLDAKNNQYKNLSNAQEAYEDFRNHEWR